RRFGATLEVRLRQLGSHVVDDEGVAGLDEVQGHRPAHVAEPAESDAHSDLRCARGPRAQNPYSRAQLSQRIRRAAGWASGSLRNCSVARGYLESPCGQSGEKTRLSARVSAAWTPG